MDKLLLQQQVCQRLEADLALLVAAAETARQAATHEESKAENKYDTRGLEASYLAAGQSRRVEEIRRALNAWRTLQLRAYYDASGIQLGALIWLEDAAGRQQCLLLGPDGAGLKLQHDGQEVVLITTQAPLGAQLLGRGPGDEVQAGPATWQILRVE
ncbi:transcription elongation factor GreAB [Pseudomonas sp. Gutcm_11s]|uniref:transcription elongation factor GreAB n=1 Tax=Pseudomonas sp. Gutcm_11s TaxID=3026088 RepID=UPI00235FFD76|nr:transcription elongation factor GreAB [Pseudomonas sp. Gutcm_11s]MDD0845216.1 transcription elongation factor GreAB [Pseudomonas sp. Gutcm_11s]